MSTQQTLAGQNSLITRPEGQGQSLGAAIANAGGTPVYYPLLQILPVKDEKSSVLLRQRIQNLDHYDLAIFISTNAAKYGLQWIDEYWPQFPEKVKLFAIGPSTAAALASLQKPVFSSASGMQSEDLLELPELRHVDGLRIALFRGVGGRELLAKTLRERGAVVDYLEVYQRSEPDIDSTDLLQTIKTRAISVIVVTSAEILASLCRHAGSQIQTIRSIPLLVPSERVRLAAIDAGFSRVINTRGASDDAILASLLKVAKSPQTRARKQN